MSVKVKLTPALATYTGNLKVVETEGSTIGEAFKKLTQKYPKLQLLDKKGNLHDHFSVFLNGKNAYPDEVKKPLKDGDEISILLVIGGG
jgi:molybdopterin converting factor small subunit